MAAMILIEGEKGFKSQNTGATIQALLMAGFERQYLPSGAQRWTKVGQPTVTIADLTPSRCPSCGGRFCPGSAHCWGI